MTSIDKCCATTATEMASLKATETENIYFSQYRVSTITCNANIGEDINLNLKMLFENIAIIDKDDTDGIVWAGYCYYC
jgi:hypothetical protein